MINHKTNTVMNIKHYFVKTSRLFYIHMYVYSLFYPNYFLYLASQSETLIQELQIVDLRDISNLWEEWIKLFFW